MDAKKSIEESLDLLAKLTQERDGIEHRMGQLHLAIRGLSNLVPDKAEREAYKAILDRYRVRTGLTELIHLGFRTFDKPLTPKEIRSFIINYGSETSTQQNLLQSIHTILRRMEESGDVVSVENEDGDKAFRLPTVTEQILGIGIQPDAASRVGKRMETRFSNHWEDVFGKYYAGEYAKPMTERTRAPKKPEATAEAMGEKFVRVARKQPDEKKK